MKTINLFCCIILLSISAVSLGQVVYFESFETLDAVFWPCDPDVGLDPNSMQFSWSTEADPNNGIVVINNAVPGTFDGNNYLRIERIANSYVHENFGGKYAVIDVNQPLNGNVSVTFSFLQTAGDMILQFITEDAVSGEESVNLWFGPTGYVSYMSYGVYEPITGLRYAQNEWNQIRIDADYANGTYDLYLNGQKVELDFGWPQTEFSKVGFYIGGNALPSILYLDAIKIETGTTDCSVPLEADMSGDCKVDLQDLSVLAYSWMCFNISPAMGN